jgi:hypothetical protein
MKPRLTIAYDSRLRRHVWVARIGPKPFYLGTVRENPLNETLTLLCLILMRAAA